MWMKHMIAEKVLRPQGWEDVNIGLVPHVDVNIGDFKPLEKQKAMGLSYLNELLIPHDFFWDIECFYICLCFHLCHL